MKNVPETIYLQVGPDCPDDADFDDLRGVTWSLEREYDNDIEFRLVKPSLDKDTEAVNAQLDE